jgi:hypothetical protein
MQRQGADPADMQPQDFLCDFCGRAWDGAFPMVEGHRGSLICGGCLTVAYTEAVLHQRTSVEPTTYTCTLCLETRDDLCWQSPARAEAFACRRCLRQSATQLDRDSDWDWTKPAGEA